MTNRSQRIPGLGSGVILFGLVVLGLASAGCVTVRPEQRAILADPSMQFDKDSVEEGQLDHVLENREGAFGGGSVKGGGCGCN